MKISRTCPKCLSKKILYIPTKVAHDNRIAVGFFSSITSTRYVCAFCGYCEEWIDSQEDLDKLIDNYGTI